MAAIGAPASFEEPYEVVGLEHRTATIAELWLRPLASVLEYVPGEYVLLAYDGDEVPPRSFSVANAPRSDGLISLLVTRVSDGETSRWVHDRLRLGQTVSISGPYGTFVDDPAATAPALFLAAGSGLAPIRALVEAALARCSRRELTLVFSARTEADVIDRGRFEQRQAENERFRFIRTLTRGAGPHARGRIPALLPGFMRTSQGTMCSSQAHPGSCGRVPPPPRLSARGASMCTRRRSSSSRSRGRTSRFRRGSARERLERRAAACLHEDG